jgi:hypothetical protein
MEIEDIIKRKPYRGFVLTELHQPNTADSRWYITRRESGMDRSYGFADSISDAKAKVDGLWNGSPQAGMARTAHV